MHTYFSEISDLNALVTINSKEFEVNFPRAIIVRNAFRQLDSIVFEGYAEEAVNPVMQPARQVEAQPAQQAPAAQAPAAAAPVKFNYAFRKPYWQTRRTA